MDTRQGILFGAAVVVGMAVIGGILAAAGAPDEAYSVFLLPAGLVFNPLTLLVVLIVFLMRRRGQQQQQQQVVVHVDDLVGASGPHVRCPGCSHLNRSAARFCGQCGAGLGDL